MGLASQIGLLPWGTKKPTHATVAPYGKEWIAWVGDKAIQCWALAPSAKAALLAACDEWYGISTQYAYASPMRVAMRASALTVDKAQRVAVGNDLVTEQDLNHGWLQVAKAWDQNVDTLVVTVPIPEGKADLSASGELHTIDASNGPVTLILSKAPTRMAAAIAVAAAQATLSDGLSLVGIAMGNSSILEVVSTTDKLVEAKEISDGR